MRHFILGVCLLVGAGHAVAGDAKNHPGAMCEATDGVGSTIVNWGRVYNPSSTASVGVDCPIVVDLSGTAGASSWVKVIDDNSVHDVSVTCTLYHMAQSGTSPSVQGYSRVSTGTPKAGTARGPTFSSNVPEKLTFSSFSTVSPVEWKHLYCIVPPKSSAGGKSYVVSYWIDEV